MQVNITFRHLEPTEALKSHAKEKVEHVQRYVDRIVTVDDPQIASAVLLAVFALVMAVESAKRLILGENLKRLLKPILETKGVKL